MIYVLVFYWIIAGIAFYSIPPQNRNDQFLQFIVCMVLGGVCIPAIVLMKIIR